MKTSCDAVFSKLSFKNLEKNLKDYPGEKDKKLQVYEYILAHKLVYQFDNIFTGLNLIFPLYRSRNKWPCVLCFLLFLQVSKVFCHISMLHIAFESL